MPAAANSHASLCISLLLWLSLQLVSCASAPPATYPDTAPVVAQRHRLQQDLLGLLPAEQRDLPEAKQEATWLADTAYKAAAGIARINKPAFKNWLNNRLVNSCFHFKERGLCWHYQHDMYRELRRQPLRFFRIGCCELDRRTPKVHSALYLGTPGTEWPHVIILEAWRNQGALMVLKQQDFAAASWEDVPDVSTYLASVYPEKHSYPMEHWAMVRSDNSWKNYIPSKTPQGAASRQGRLMQSNIRNALRDRNGKLTNY